MKLVLVTSLRKGDWSHNPCSPAVYFTLTCTWFEYAE
jgi:hypothetical protein